MAPASKTGRLLYEDMVVSNGKVVASVNDRRVNDLTLSFSTYLCRVSPRLPQGASDTV